MDFLHFIIKYHFVNVDEQSYDKFRSCVPYM